MTTIEMSDSQAREIAYCIYKDIENYIKHHHEKYLKFLTSEKLKEKYHINE